MSKWRIDKNVTSNLDSVLRVQVSKNYEKDLESLIDIIDRLGFNEHEKKMVSNLISTAFARQIVLRIQ